MRVYSYFALVSLIIVLPISPAIAHPASSNYLFDYAHVDNGTLAHTLCNSMFELDEYTDDCYLWRPFQPNYNQLQSACLWVCITGGINKAVFEWMYWDAWYPFGPWVNQISQPGEPSWLGLPVMSDHDTYVGTNDDGYIGLEACRHTLMWDNPLDADYIVYIYSLKNVTSNPLNNLYISRFSNFNLSAPDCSSQENICGTDFATQTVWMKERQNNCNCWVGIRRLNGNLSRQTIG